MIGADVIKRVSDDLDDFRHTFGVEENDPGFWATLVDEEAEEATEAACELLKELIDCLYVQTGMYLAAMDKGEENKELEALLLMRTTFMEATRVFNIDEVWKAWDAVHANNMSKVGPDGKVVRDPDTGKVLKPEGFKKVNLKEVLNV